MIRVVYALVIPQGTFVSQSEAAKHPSAKTGGEYRQSTGKLLANYWQSMSKEKADMSVFPLLLPVAIPLHCLLTS
jgi:hypothetical protein